MVYIDESGDLGSTSKYLVFASIITDHPRKLDKLIKKIWIAKPQLHFNGELHANSTDDSTKVRVLKTLTESGVRVNFTAVKKSSLKGNMSENYYTVLSNFIDKFTAANIIIVDKKDTNKHRSAILSKLGLVNNFAKVEFRLSHTTRQLQAVDFVAWAIGRKYEKEDSKYYSIIESLLK